jgi:hypothetical protein
MVRVYLAGPMSDSQDANGVDHVPAARLAAFERAELWLRTNGLTWLPIVHRGAGEAVAVFNPADEYRRCPFITRHACIRRDMKILADSEIIFALDGYQKSVGCALELAVALHMGLAGWHLSETLGLYPRYELHRLL